MTRLLLRRGQVSLEAARIPRSLHLSRTVPENLQVAMMTPRLPKVARKAPISLQAARLLSGGNSRLARARLVTRPVRARPVTLKESRHLLSWVARGQ